MSGVKTEDEDVDNSIAEYLKKHDINVTGENTPSPVLKFEDASLPGNILKFVQQQFDAPTPIQSQVEFHSEERLQFCILSISKF